MIVPFSEISAMAWYAMQHYMNIVDMWMSRRATAPSVSIAYFAGQYADLNVRLLDEGAERDSLGNALVKIYGMAYARAPKSADNVMAFFSSGGYYSYTDNWHLLAPIIDAAIRRGQDGPRRKED